MSEPIRNAIMTPHALLEMQRRAVDAVHVRAVLLAPEQRLPVHPGRHVLQSRILIDGETYLVRVFVDIDREPPEVVTVYRTNKIDKYWRANS